MLLCFCNTLLQKFSFFGSHNTPLLHPFTAGEPEKILPLVVVVVSEDVRKKRARKPLRRKSIKGFFSEATFHIHKFSTFSPYSTCLLLLLLRCVIKFFPTHSKLFSPPLVSHHPALTHPLYSCFSLIFYFPFSLLLQHRIFF